MLKIILIYKHINILLSLKRSNHLIKSNLISYSIILLLLYYICITLYDVLILLNHFDELFWHSLKFAPGA